jgi:hypothetical protein
MDGYYLNNARWRLIDAREALRSAQRLTGTEEELRIIDEVDDVSVIEGRSTDCWLKLHETLRLLLISFRKTQGS